MNSIKCNGHNYLLEKFMGMHRSSYVQLEESSRHIDFQLPFQHNRVGFHIDDIQKNAPDLRAAIGSICLNIKNM